MGHIGSRVVTVGHRWSHRVTHFRQDTVNFVNLVQAWSVLVLVLVLARASAVARFFGAVPNHGGPIERQATGRSQIM